MGNFFAELKRRHIYRVAVAYAVVGVILVQLVGIVMPAFDMPAWTGRATFWFLGIGFPVVLIFAWVHELGSGSGHSTAAHTTTKLDWVLAGGLAVVIAIFAYQQLGPSPGTQPAQQANVAAPAPSQPQAASISIAVLPFVNLSGDASQEFFSDGMTEEITSALAKIPSLQVVARTSAFEFKGQNRNIQAIGQQLHSRYLIEGSVRKAGDRVRITAQLIKSDDGTHVWTENYDRLLTDIFATQEDIAQAIAVALKVPLGLAQGDALVRDRATDLESYQQYLRAKALYRALEPDRAIMILNALLANDPSYAPAWATLARAYRSAPGFTPVFRSGRVEDARRALLAADEKAQVATRRAIELDPRFAYGYSMLGAMRLFEGKWAEADDLAHQALGLDASEPDVLESYRFLLASSGRLKEALRVSAQVQTLEPFIPIFNVHAAEVMQLNGQNDASIPILESAPLGSDNYSRNSDLAKAYAASGRYQEAADTILAMRTNQVSRQTIEDAARIIRTAPAVAVAPDKLPTIDGSLNFVYAYVGARERMLERPERNIQIGTPSTLYWVWDPIYAPLRKTERFKAILRAFRLIDYWRARGWPDLCRPVSADDFVCD